MRLQTLPDYPSNMIIPSQEANSVDGSESGTLAGYSSTLLVPPTEEKPPEAITDRTTEPGDPHGALFFVLGYLRLPDLLSSQSVCKSFWYATIEDRLLWLDIVVEPPLSGKLTDDSLLRVASKAEGKLRTLALKGCLKITDAGLQQVVDGNPCITKLYLPGCTCLTADGVVNIVKSLSERNGNLKQLQVYGIQNVKKEHLDILNSFLHNNYPQQSLKPIFFNHRHSSHFWDDGRPIDIDICPRCRDATLVYNCTRENCRWMKDPGRECRGCFRCIPRCENCGDCVDDFQEPGEETACSCVLCLMCWLRLPKCNMCNLPYCKRHTTCHGECSGFVCEDCKYREWKYLLSMAWNLEATREIVDY